MAKTHAEGHAGTAKTRAEGPQVVQRSSMAKTHAEGLAGTAETRAEGQPGHEGL